MIDLTTIHLFDGAMGTMLQQAGLPAGTPPETMNLTAPQAVEAVHAAYVSAGAGFVVALTGAIMTMPGLPKKPAADGIDVDENGAITGLF